MSAAHARVAWAALILFIVYGSWGTMSGAPHDWARTGGIPDVAQNVLLYVPFGILAAISIAGTPVRPAAMAIAVVAASAISLAVESLQLFMADRTASIVDVIAAACGATAGAIAANVTAYYANRAGEALPRRLVTGATGTALIVILAATTALAWWPFDVTLDVSTTLERLRASRAIFLSDPAPIGVLILKAALFAAVSCLVFSAVSPTQRGAFLIAVALLIAYALALDAGQGLMGARPAGLATLGCQLTGAAAGAGIAALSRARP